MIDFDYLLINKKNISSLSNNFYPMDYFESIKSEVIEFDQEIIDQFVLYLLEYNRNIKDVKCQLSENIQEIY